MGVYTKMSKDNKVKYLRDVRELFKFEYNRESWSDEESDFGVIVEALMDFINACPLSTKERQAFDKLVKIRDGGN